MLDFYYQIKAKDLSEFGISPWAFPPLFCGKVSAESKMLAKSEIESEYDRKFPLRVLKKDLHDNHFLLKIEEIKHDSRHILRLFEVRDCKRCHSSFKVINSYNDHNQRYKGPDFCSDQCKDAHYEENRVDRSISSAGSEPWVIYRVLNLRTQMCYIGKTSQVFTLRWYQHFYQGGDCKFHKAVKESSVTDWQFSVIEEIALGGETNKDAKTSERERFWIDNYDSVANGYNTLHG